MNPFAKHSSDLLTTDRSGTGNECFPSLGACLLDLGQQCGKQEVEASVSYQTVCHFWAIMLA
uniref:Uncharacterized protein n=1 Tax=Trichinella nativa TaxID=6335 RepID=A0A0V1KK81_9BILA